MERGPYGQGLNFFKINMLTVAAPGTLSSPFGGHVLDLENHGCWCLLALSVQHWSFTLSKPCPSDLYYIILLTAVVWDFSLGLPLPNFNESYGIVMKADQTTKRLNPNSSSIQSYRSILHKMDSHLCPLFTPQELPMHHISRSLHREILVDCPKCLSPRIWDMDQT